MKIPDNAQHIDKLIKKYNFKFGAELGVRRGEFSIYLLSNNVNLQMACVDVWEDHPSLDEKHNHQSNYKTFIDSVDKYFGRVFILKMLTEQACQFFNDNSFDFVFIDATHTYNSVSSDIRLWAPKVKETGIISGHDYCMNFDKGGIIRAVKELDKDIIELSRGKSVDCNVDKTIELLGEGRSVADLQTGCWFVWKNKYANV